MRRPSRLALAAGAVVVAAGATAAGLLATGGPTIPSRRSTPSAMSHRARSSHPTTSSVASPTAPPGTANTSTSVASPTSAAAHVMVIVLENHGYSTIVGSPTTPYLNQLATRYGLATASYATGHPSLPNYLELVSGSTQGITTDCTTTCTANGPQLVDQLRAGAIGWRAYMEGAPGPCYTGSGAYPYDRHHDPFVYAPHIVEDRARCDDIVPYATLAPALAQGRAPPFLWVTPDVQHDMHTGSVREGDLWLSQQLPTVLRSAWYRDRGVVVITFDESTGGTSSGCCTGAAGGHVATIVVSARTPRGARLNRPVDGAGILRTIEALYHLPYLGAAANRASGTLLPLLGETALR